MQALLLILAVVWPPTQPQAGGTASAVPLCASVEVGGQGAGTVWQVP